MRNQKDIPTKDYQHCLTNISDKTRFRLQEIHRWSLEHLFGGRSWPQIPSCFLAPQPLASKYMVHLDHDRVLHFPETVPMIAFNNEVLFPQTEMVLFLEGQFNLKLVADCLKTTGYLGTIQALPNKSNSFFNTGTLAKIVQVIDMNGDAIQIMIRGCIRFDIIKFFKEESPYYKAAVDYGKYMVDIDENEYSTINRNQLILTLRKLLQDMDLLALDWDILDQCSHKNLIKHLTQICPLNSTQKQHILESENVNEQSTFLAQCMEEVFYDMKVQ